ncbi:MAG TPA: hypothetical protein VJY39_21110 [Acidisphaera sp.]|nr:hypothetical protein [Acidisphaera sp.]
MPRSPLVLAYAAAAALMLPAAFAQQQPTPTPSGAPLQPSPGQPSGSAAQGDQFGATAAAPGTSQPAPEGPSVTGQAPAPSFNILGSPVTINAPVAPSYSNSAYSNFGGQPQRSGDQLLNWRRDRD